MRKLRRYWLTVFGLAIASASTAQATTLFSDGFPTNSDTVGNGWVEQEVAGPAVQVAGQELRMTGASDPTATQFSISTVGFENITFSYDWRGAAAEVGDLLTVSWSADGVNFTVLASHDLNDASFQTESWLLPAGAEGIATLAIRFTVDANNLNDQGRVDNVLVTGDALPSPVPEPASLALLGGALLGLAVTRHRRKLRRLR